MTGDRLPARAGPAARTVASIVLVWVISFGAYHLHLSAVAAVVWTVAVVIVCPIGATVTDRIVALSLLAAAPAVLIAWVSPLVPWLVSPVVLTGLLGTAAAVAWGLRIDTRPRWTAGDGVSTAMGTLVAVFYWFPFALGGLDRTIGVLSAGFDQIAHYFLWVQVWANHGYLLINTLPEPDAWGWRVYPQGAHAVLADLGTVLTSRSEPITDPATSASLFGALVCVQAGVLALFAAWGVDRLSRCWEQTQRGRTALLQVLAAALIAVGPGSVIAVQSASFTAGVSAILVALVLAVTCSKSPRLNGILLGAALISASAMYPICALAGIGLWPLYVWTSRGYWSTSRARKWGLAGLTVAVAVLCAPMFVVLVTRKIDHNWDAAGYFQALNPVSFISVAVLLALMLILAPGRLPSPVTAALWLAAAVTAILIIEGLWQWLTAGSPTYYTIKTMYLGWMMSVIAVAGAAACVHRRAAGADADQTARPRVRSILRSGAAIALVVGATLLGVPTSRVQSDDPSQGWEQALSKKAWVIYHQNSFASQYGAVSVSTARFAADHDGVTVFAPCVGDVSQTALRWALALTGGMSQTDMEVFEATCPGSQQAVLGTLPQYLRAHPEVSVNALTLDEDAHQHALAIKAAYGLSNLRIFRAADLQLP